MPFPYTFPIIFGVVEGITAITAITAIIDGDTPQLRKGFTSIDLRIEARSLAEFTVVDILETLSYQQGQPVTVYDPTSTLKFGGVIDSVETFAMSPAGGLFHSIRCKDYHYFADKRLVAESYTSQTTGYIVDDIFDKYLAEEGVTIGLIEAGPTIVEAIFNYIRVTDCFDALAEKAGKIWFIDENKALYFQDRDVTAAPWSATTADINVARLTEGNPKYRNRQFIRGGRDTTVEQTETFTGDGTTVAFTMGFPFERVPTVTVNTVGQSIGIKGLDTTKDCYWNKGDATLTFDSGSIPGAVAIVVVYYGQYDILVLAENNAEILTQAAIEGSGTGKVEDIDDEPTLNDKDASIDSAEAKVTKFGVDGQRFRYKTTRTGLLPGQLQAVTYPLLGLNATDMLIESVVIRGLASLVTYDIVAITGPEHGGWQEYFKALGSQKQQIFDRLNVGTEQILIILATTAETIEISESIVENVYTCPICGIMVAGLFTVC